MTNTDTLVLAFDPGATTGFAALTSEKRVLYTAALILDELDGFAELLSPLYYIELQTEVLIEVGPDTHHHSPITRRVEATLRELFPDAHLIPPNQWKNHPAAREARSHRYKTLHEKDAVSIAHWFLATGGISANSSRDTAARTNSNRTGRIGH